MKEFVNVTAGDQNVKVALVHAMKEQRQQRWQYVVSITLR
jgi:hypothetical protein